MENTVEIYQEEKELRGKRLAAYAESIQEKVQKDSEQIIKILVEERYRQKKTQQEMADITGVRASNIARFEKASRVPTLLMLEKYANALEKHIEIRITEDCHRTRKLRKTYPFHFQYEKSPPKRGKLSYR